MTKITNNHSKTPIALPDGTYLAPGATEDAPGWKDYKDRPSIKAYLESGHLSTGGPADVDPESDPEGAEQDEETEEEKEEEVKDVDEKDALIAQLTELGVQADRRSSVATLTAKLEEAKAAQ